MLQIFLDLYGKEIKTRYFTKFLFGELDLEAGWDEFVNEYNAAALDKYISAYGKAYASLKNVFEAIQ